MLVDPTVPEDVISVRTADRGAEPDLLVGRLFVDDVGPVLVQLDSEHPIRESGVSPHQTVVVLDQLAEPVVEALQGLVAQLEVVVEVSLSFFLKLLLHSILHSIYNWDNINKYVVYYIYY